MKTLPINAGAEQIQALVVEWHELLAQEKYAEAMDLIMYDNTQIIDGEPWLWTAEKLAAAVYTYGEPWYTKEDMERFYPGWPDYKVTSLLSDGGLPQDMRIDIYFYDFVVSPEQARMWCIEKLDYANIIGDVHFDNVMLNNKRSDLTAIFWLVKVDGQNITLLFKDLHVM